MAKKKGGGKRLKDPSTSFPKRYALRSKGPLQNTRVEEGERKNKRKRSLMTMRKPKGVAERFEVENDPVDSPRICSRVNSRPRCSFPLTKKFPKKDGIVVDPFYDDPEYIPLLHEKMEELSLKFATAALSYLCQQGDDYELVMVDHYQGTIVGGGARFHHNFTAKRAGVPFAPTETFFSQVFERKVDGFLKDVIIECCVSLGESDRLPKRRDKRGCDYCTKYVHHPTETCPGLWMGIYNPLTYVPV